MSYGPPASRLIFLTDLPHQQSGDKVRFLGCVQAYEPTTATLILAHAYPASVHPPVQARVDARLVLEAVRATDLDVGAWVNVIGYAGAVGVADGVVQVRVQAVLVWEARGLRLDEYESALSERRRAEARGGAMAR